MKKILSVILIAMSMCISCSDDFDAYSELDKLLGTWKCEQDNTEYVLEIINGIYSETEQLEYLGSYYKIDENGYKTYKHRNLILGIKYKHKDILCFSAGIMSSKTFEYQYQLKGNVLTIDDKTFHKEN